MENKIAPSAATPDPTTGPPPAASRSATELPAKRTPPDHDPVDMRLVIEEDANAGGTYVYKTINRLTGEVILQLPREQLLKLRERVTYAAGDVVRTKA